MIRNGRDRVNRQMFIEVYRTDFQAASRCRAVIIIPCNVNDRRMLSAGRNREMTGSRRGTDDRREAYCG